MPRDVSYSWSTKGMVMLPPISLMIAFSAPLFVAVLKRHFLATIKEIGDLDISDEFKSA